MSIFTDYAAKARQQFAPIDVAKKNPAFDVQPAEQPQIDSSNAIGSLATLLGPTPAEREARERRMMENKSKMQAWTGLFDGLRQLGNLYYTYKGATPQQLGSPYQAIDQQYQQQRAIADANDQYARQYAQSLYNLRRQVNEDARKDILANAQAEYYGTRDEMARQKAELDKLKAVKVIKQKDGSLMKFDPISGVAEPLSEADPLYVDYMKARTKATEQQGNAAMIRANKAGGSRSSGGRNNGTYGYKTTTYYDEEGRKVTERVPTTGGVPMKTVQEPKKPVQQPKKPSQSKANKQIRKGATNNSGFFN